MRFILYLFALLSVLFSGALFGFFYAWVCSTMWGLDTLPPTVAIQAMQAMNESVRNAVFAPVFFGTWLVLLVTAVIAFRARSRGAAVAFLLGALVCLFGATVLTMSVNVPMNEDLARVTLPLSEADAEPVWTAFSDRWQEWNLARTLASGVGLAFAALGLALVSRRPARSM